MHTDGTGGGDGGVQATSVSTYAMLRDNMQIKIKKIKKSTYAKPFAPTPIERICVDGLAKARLCDWGFRAASE